MAPNRQAGESSRRVNRHLNASPYARKVPNQPKSNPQADAGQVKKGASLAALFSIFNPFNYLGKRNEPPQSLPQLRARHESSSQEEEQTGHESDTNTELDAEDDSMFVDHALNGPLASSQKSPEKYHPNQIPFPLVSPAKNWETTPGASRRGNVAPTTNAFSRGPFTPASPASSAHTSATVEHTVGSPLKPIQDFLGRRTRAGAGLSPEEVQQLTGMLSAQNIGRDESDLPTAAFLARDFSPSPSKSFLAPQQASSPFRFEAGNNAGSTAMSTASSARQRRHRPIYVGPGQGSNLRPSRSSVVMPPLPSSLLRPSISGTVPDLQPAEELSGKRRRVDGLPSAESPSFKTQDTNAAATPSQPPNETHPDAPPAPSSTSTTGTSRTVPSVVSARGGPLRGHPTASPAVPSPLRNMTKAEDPPSPPRRSLTSTAVMNIIARADKELSVSESKAEVEQAIVNPYERTGPKIPMANRRKPIPVKKAAPLPPKPEPKKPELPSSAQAIADSLPTPKAPAAKSSSNGNVFKAPFAKSTGSSSPFLPPGKTAPSDKTNGSSLGPFTIDDVDDEDEIMEVSAPEGSSSKSQVNGSSGRARGPSPPPIVIEELSEEEMAEYSQKAAKPSLVVESTEPKRMGRSPSLGPYPNLYSPTIPSPLRLVSMPEEDELAEDIEIPDVTVQPKQSIPRAAALDLAPAKPNDVEMVDGSNTDPKSRAEKAPTSSLPSYEFDFTITTTAIVSGIDISAKAKASAVLRADLPKFDMFVVGPTPVQTSTAPTNNWAAAGFVPKAADTGSWTCTQCMLSNPESAKDKCTICEADRPGAKTKPAAIAPPPSQPAPVNNWAASGFKFSTPSAGTWTCSTCMLSNPASAKDKCTFCEADAPGSKAGTSTAAVPPPTQPTSSFNWDAAGFKPTAAAPGSWTCSVCGLSNGPELVKCGVCEAAR